MERFLLNDRNWTGGSAMKKRSSKEEVAMRWLGQKDLR
jgi:hypothetical protein